MSYEVQVLRRDWRAWLFGVAWDEHGVIIALGPVAFEIRRGAR